jgi:hypothetical protein
MRSPVFSRKKAKIFNWVQFKDALLSPTFSSTELTASGEKT